MDYYILEVEAPFNEQKCLVHKRDGEEVMMSDDDFDNKRNDNDDPSFGDHIESGIWDSDDAISALKMERTVHPDESSEQMTRRMLEEAAPLAAQSIIHLALHSGNDNTRLNASKYITDTVLDPAANGTNKQVWEDMIGDVVSQAEIFANGG